MLIIILSNNIVLDVVVFVGIDIINVYNYNELMISLWY